MRTTAEQNKALARRFGEAMNGRQFDLLDDIVASDFVRHCQATPQADVRSLRGSRNTCDRTPWCFLIPSRLRSTYWRTGTSLPFGQRTRAPREGRWGPFPPSGRKMQLEFGAVLRVENGMIAEMWVTWDNMAALAQLGHLPAVPSGSS